MLLPSGGLDRITKSEPSEELELGGVRGTWLSPPLMSLSDAAKAAVAMVTWVLPIYWMRCLYYFVGDSGRITYVGEKINNCKNREQD